MKRLILVSLPIFIVTACNSSPEKQAEDKVVTSNFKAGKWDSASQIVAAEIPGMPSDMMKAAIGEKNTFSHCMTQEEAQKNAEDMFKKSGDGSCTYDRFNMGGGKIDAKMTCTGDKKGSSSTITMTGTHDVENYAMEVEMQISSPDIPSGRMLMKMTTTGKRVGECS